MTSCPFSGGFVLVGPVIEALEGSTYSAQFIDASFNTGAFVYR